MVGLSEDLLWEASWLFLYNIGGFFENCIPWVVPMSIVWAFVVKPKSIGKPRKPRNLKIDLLVYRWFTNKCVHRRVGLFCWSFIFRVSKFWLCTGANQWILHVQLRCPWVRTYFSFVYRFGLVSRSSTFSRSLMQVGFCKQSSISACIFLSYSCGISFTCLYSSLRNCLDLPLPPTNNNIYIYIYTGTYTHIIFKLYLNTHVRPCIDCTRCIVSSIECMFDFKFHNKSKEPNDFLATWYLPKQRWWIAHITFSYNFDANAYSIRILFQYRLDLPPPKYILCLCSISTHTYSYFIVHYTHVRPCIDCKSSKTCKACV